MSSTEIITMGDISYMPEVAAVIVEGSSADAMHDADDPINVGKYRISPWGENNDMPQQVMAKIGAGDVVGSNLDFNIRCMYGQGVQPFLRFVENGKERLDICTDQAVLDFIEDNDVPGYFLEQCADMATFWNTFPEVILSRDLRQIVSLRHKEAAFSRWGVVDKKTGEIIKHYYAGKWEDGAKEEDIIPSDVLNRVNPLADLRNRIDQRKAVTPRFILQLNFPSPGRTYYQMPPWWSIFRSGSYDYSTMIWKFKKALLKNGLRVRYVIYVSDKYWDLIFREEKIDQNDPKAVTERKTAEFEKFRKFLSDEENAGKGIMALKKIIPSGSTAIEEKMIQFEILDPKAKGGELLDDSSEVNNVISYGMGVHQHLIGTTPGKSGGSFSGSDKRELYMIKSALAAPFRDRLIRPLNLIKRFNGWPENLVWRVVDYNFTKLDDNKSGKEQGTQSNNQNTEA